MSEGIGAADQAGHRSATGDLPILTTERLDADPHGIFRIYRRTHSLVAHEAGGYFVLRLADVERFSRDPRARASETAFPEMHSVTDGALFDGIRYGMLTANGSAHRRRRSPFTRTFAARMITELRPYIRRSAEELVDRWYADGQVNFLEQFAAQVPARVISDLLGLPREDIPSFTKLVYNASRFISLSFTPDEIPDIEAAARQLQDYVERTLDHRRRAPCGDFLSKFVAAADLAAEMSPIEIIFQIVQLIVGGTDTTRVAIVMQVALLLQHHEQWTAVCRDPGLIPAAVEESMRFEPSVASISRVAAEDIEVGGAIIPAGAFVTLSTMSGMRDERAYDNPDVFNIRRVCQPRLHPIFGGGPHRCIGEMLARAELEESLAVLTARIPQLRLEQAPAIKGHFGIRRVDTMRVSWRV
jgi:cytochrome P450 family 103